MNTEKMDGILFSNMIRGGAENLRRNQSVVNDLNVFPIPDGDTGDNMFMTFRSGSDNLSDRDSDIGSASFDAAHGMLLGARGNSGVILSRIFSGIADALDGKVNSDVSLLCDAFKSGVSKSYGAVSTPVEGTILTVFREATEYVCARRSQYRNLEDLFEDFLIETRRSLERTPDLLKVLKDSGVVDSGGAGLYYIIEGMKKVLEGEMLSPGSDVIGEDGNDARPLSSLGRLDENDPEVYGYCTEFLLQLMPSKPDFANFSLEGLNDYLLSVGGESIVSFREGDVVKVHVHTHHPGEVIAYCQRFGEYLKFKIENMTLQSKSATVQNRFSASHAEEAPVLRAETPRKKLAFVAVASGDGVRKLFTDAGADFVIDGGQSNNPPTEAFLDAFRSVNADKIVVLPNNKNILLTANAAAELFRDSEVSVFPSRSVGEGFSALGFVDRDCEDLSEILDQMKQGCDGVVTGMVSRAIRDSVTGGVTVRTGDYLGFVDGDILSDAPDANSAALSLASALSASEHDVLILLAGEKVNAKEFSLLTDAIGTAFPQLEVIPMQGNQPIYDYLLILE